jgi:predicted ATPase/DNA-binding CsgD family transcriptional regulator
VAVSPILALGRTGGNLPFEMTSFVGRRRELSEITRVLSSSRLVTLTGIGGAGKSRLAVHVARDVRRAFPDGVWFVELDRVTDPGLLPHTILGVLGIRDYSPNPADLALAELLSDKSMLLVLDNCEHIAEACAQLVRTVMAAASEVRLLATSREPLNVAGEITWQVPPLSMPEPHTTGADYSRYEAFVLFEQRARAVLPNFAPHPDDWPTIAEICRVLDGNALALELAAARVPVLSVAQILSRLDARFRLLTGGRRTAPPRHQTLYAAVDGSFELCSKPERRLWMGASVFQGGFDLESAEAVCSGEDLPREQVLDALAGLVAKSVVTREDDDGRSRFRLLETIRQYGRGQLREAGEDRAQQQCHRDYFLALAERAEQEWFGPRQVDWLTRLRREWPNFWAALEFSSTADSEGDSGLRLGGALWPYWIAAGYVSEGTMWLDRILATHIVRRPARAKALWVNALSLALQGDPMRARALMAECHEILRGSRDERALAAARRVAGTVEMLAGNHVEAVPWLEEAVRHLAATDQLDSVAVLAYADLGVVKGLSGDVERAIELCEQGRALCESHGETWALSWIMSVLCFLLLVQDDQQDITRDLSKMLRIKEAFGDVLGVLHAAEMLAWVAGAHGDARRAAHLMGATEALWKPLGAYLLGFQPYLERHAVCVARARTALGDTAFESAAHAGADLDFERLVSYALGGAADAPAVSPAPPKRPHGDLTPRQWEVAQLIARGMSNKEIGHHLVISQRTAEGHVESILVKLGFTSRAQVAAWVIEQAQAATDPTDAPADNGETVDRRRHPRE